MLFRTKGDGVRETASTALELQKKEGSSDWDTFKNYFWPYRFLDVWSFLTVDTWILKTNAK